MKASPTSEDVRQSLRDHVAAKGAEVREKYGPNIGWHELQRILLDRACVRYPCEIVYSEAVLGAGEFAHPVPKGAVPEDGFTMYVHPYFSSQPNRVPALVLYQLVLVNYGEFTSHEDAESFGAQALGLTTDDYYALLCTAADEVTPAAEMPQASG